MPGDAVYQEDEYLPLSGIQHYAFCPRQWALIHVEQQWAENGLTVAGDQVHERCHDETIRERRGNLLILRGLRVSSARLGLSGICDVVEFHRCEDGASLFNEEGFWMPAPVEYKRGKAKPGDEDCVQVCAQAMALEEMFCLSIQEGYLFYDSEKHREVVQLTESLRQLTRDIAHRMHVDFSRGFTPMPKKKKACRACSCKDICTPELDSVESVQSYVARMIGEQ